jgi:hypothetical protein
MRALGDKREKQLEKEMQEEGVTFEDLGFKAPVEDGDGEGMVEEKKGDTVSEDEKKKEKNRKQREKKKAKKAEAKKELEKVAEGKGEGSDGGSEDNWS